MSSLTPSTSCVRMYSGYVRCVFTCLCENDVAEAVATAPGLSDCAAFLVGIERPASMRAGAGGGGHWAGVVIIGK